MRPISAFVINLDRRTQRISHFMSQTAISAFDIERISAVFWKDISIPQSWHRLNCGPGGGYATTISHRNAIMEAKKQALSHVVVFEDDAIVPPWFPQELQRFCRHLPDNWDLVFFGGFHARSPWPQCFPVHHSGPVYRGYHTYQLECYMVNAKAYDSVLEILQSAIDTPRGWPSGAFAQMQKRLNFYVPLNLPISQPVGWCGSDNWNKSVNREWAEGRVLIEGWFTDREGIQYLSECMKVPGETVVELGTWMGRSTSWVAEWIHSHKGTLYCVDLWQKWSRPRNRTPWQDFEWYMWKTNLLDKISVLQSDTAEAATSFTDESVGLVMFDADHGEEGLKRELDAWIPKVRKGGILCGHDYNNPSHPAVTKVINSYFGKPKKVIDWFWVVDKQ